MHPLPKSKPVNLHGPTDTHIFKDSSDNWLAFRKIRYKTSGDGEYAILRALDLSEYFLEDFATNWLVFMNCKLDNASLYKTEFSHTVFIECSMRDVDLTESIATDALFLNCDLTGAKISTKKPYMQWVSEDMDGKDVPSIFINCKLDETTKQWLIKNKCSVSGSHFNMTDRIEDRLFRVNTAPTLNL